MGKVMHYLQQTHKHTACTVTYLGVDSELDLLLFTESIRNLDLQRVVCDKVDRLCSRLRSRQRESVTRLPTLKPHHVFLKHRSNNVLEVVLTNLNVTGAAYSGCIYAWKLLISQVY